MQKQFYRSFYDEQDNVLDALDHVSDIADFMGESFAAFTMVKGEPDMSRNAFNGCAFLASMLGDTLRHASDCESRRIQSGESREFNRGRDHGYTAGYKAAMAEVAARDAALSVAGEKERRAGAGDDAPAGGETYPKVGPAARPGAPPAAEGEAAPDTDDDSAHRAAC